MSDDLHHELAIAVVASRATYFAAACELSSILTERPFHRLSREDREAVAEEAHRLIDRIDVSDRSFEAALDYLEETG